MGLRKIVTGIDLITGGEAYRKRKGEVWEFDEKSGDLAGDFIDETWLWKLWKIWKPSQEKQRRNWCQQLQAVAEKHWDNRRWAWKSKYWKS